MSELGPVPPLDYDAYIDVERAMVDAAAAPLLAYAHAARERIAQLEGENQVLRNFLGEAPTVERALKLQSADERAERLGKLLDEARKILMYTPCDADHDRPGCATCGLIDRIEQERQQP